MYNKRKSLSQMYVNTKETMYKHKHVSCIQVHLGCKSKHQLPTLLCVLIVVAMVKLGKTQLRSMIRRVANDCRKEMKIIIQLDREITKPSRSVPHDVVEVLSSPPQCNSHNI